MAFDVWERFRQVVEEGDKHLESGRVQEALEHYQPVANALRALLDGQTEGAPGGVPLSLRMIVGTDDLTVPLSRIAVAHEAAGDHQEATQAWREIEQRIERVLPMTMRESRSQLESRLADAKAQLRRLKRPGLVRWLFELLRR